MTASGARPNRSLFVFTRDLRLGDHAGLAAAARFGTVYPVLIVDPAAAGRLRRCARRAAFYCAAVAALDRDLRARGSRLIVARGPAGPMLLRLARRFAAGTAVWTYDYDADSLLGARDLQSVLEEAGLRAIVVHDAPVVAPEDESAVNARGDGYRAFAPYYARWRSIDPAQERVPAIDFAGGVESEALPQPAEFDSAAGMPDVSEERAATALSRYLEFGVLGYAAGRNVPAVHGTSRLSADLAFGTIAARTIVRAVRARARDPFLLTEEKISLRLFLRAFALRDFFLQLAWHTETLGDTPLQPKMRAFAFARRHRHLTAWREGRTGFPIVDAGVRELHATGWMHPRVQAIAASFLCFDLGVDWRVGRDEWDRWLIADSPVLATANWQWSAGVGADFAAYPRIYNPRKAARRFDPAATYIRRWIPELALADDDAILAPEMRPAERQMRFDLFGPRTYPAPVLDHRVAARRFLERYQREVGAGPA